MKSAQCFSPHAGTVDQPAVETPALAGWRHLVHGRGTQTNLTRAYVLHVKASPHRTTQTRGSPTKAFGRNMRINLPMPSRLCPYRTSMRASVLGLYLDLCVLPLFAGTADIHLFCSSIEFHPVTNGVETLSLTQFDPPVVINGELLPTFTEGIDSHVSVYLETTASGTQVKNLLTLNVPEDLDGNQDGVPDVYQVSMGHTNLMTTGLFDPEQPTLPAVVTAQWTRPAGSLHGTCELSFSSAKLAGTFVHSYEIREYSASFAYTRAGTNGFANVLLTRLGSPSKTLAGPLKFEIESSDSIRILGATWVDESASHFVFQSPLDLSRTGGVYLGRLEVDDGNPANPFPDYQNWIFQILDHSDSNSDGTPDLSDPATIPPALSIRVLPSSQIELSWPLTRVYVLVTTTTNLTSGALWNVIERPVTVKDNQNTITFDAPPIPLFYRLTPNPAP